MKIFYYLIIIILITNCNPGNEKSELKYEPFSTSIIHLKVEKPFRDTIEVKAHAFTNIPYGTSRSEMLGIKKNGHFYLSINIDRPTKSCLEIENEEFNIILIPNDTTHVDLNANESNIKISFSGSAKPINAYYFEKKNNLKYTDIRSVLRKFTTASSTYNSIKKATDSITYQALTFLQNYKSSPFLPDWFVEYETAEILYSGAGYKVSRPSRNTQVKLFKDSLPHNYYSFLDEIEVDNPRAIFSSYYFTFLDYYFLRSFEENRNLSRRENFIASNSHILEKSKIQLTGKVKEIYHTRKFTQAIKPYSSMSQYDSLANAFQLTTYNNLIPILKKGDVIMDFKFQDESDSTMSLRSFKDQILYINFWATSCRPCIERIPDLNKMIKKFENDQRVAFINICIDSEKDRYNSILEKHNIDGINVNVDYNQSTKLKKHFNFSGYPNYVLVDKGNILVENHTDKAPVVQTKIQKLLD